MPFPVVPRRRISNTVVNRHPEFVYSNVGYLVHRVKKMELCWWDYVGMDGMQRRDDPWSIYNTVCGMSFTSHSRYGATTCMAPRPEAEHCGVCNERPPTFSPRGANPSLRDAKMRLGCTAEASG